MLNFVRNPIVQIFISAFLLHVVYAADWSYGDYNTWSGFCQNGTSQSPIDLVPRDAIDRVYSAFVFHNYDKSYTGKVKNNGHSIAITLDKLTSGMPKVSGGGLAGEYVLDHIHFHWLSEHTVNSYSFPMEMHLVHYSTKFNDLNEAAAGQGVAVLGVFFELSLDDDEDFVPLIEVMEKVVKYPSEEVPLERTISPKSFLPRNTADYFRYQGSLTTPGCNEGVVWTIFEKPLPISADQYNHFESTYSPEGPLTSNFRPVQPLNGRIVAIRHSPTRSPRPDNGASVTNEFNLVLVLFSAVIALLFQRSS